MKKIDTIRLDIFLDEVTDSLGTLEAPEYWPLNASQLLAYFDSDFLIDFYRKLYQYLDSGITKDEIAKKFINADQLVDFLINYACLGLKVAEKFDLMHTSFEDRAKFFNDIFDIIEIIYPPFFNPKKEAQYINNKFSRTLKDNLSVVNEENRRVINNFKVSLFGLTWSYYYDLFAVYGSTFYGPYKIKKNNKKLLLIVDEYYNQKPFEIWPRAKENKFKKVLIYNLFDPFNYKYNIFGRSKTSDSVGDKLRYAKIIIDGKVADNKNALSQITQDNYGLMQKQTQFVESLSDMQKVDKAILMTYWTYRDFFGNDWKKLYTKTRKNLKLFGDKYIKEDIKTSSDYNKKENYRRFDPRNNYY